MTASLKYRPKGATEAAKALGRLARAGEDTTPLMEEIGSYLMTAVDRRFEREEGPDGQKWRPTHRGGAILQDTGRLRRSISSKATKRQVRVGSNLIYAATHQFGAVIEPKNAARLAFRMNGKLVFAKRVTIPARPFLGINGGDLDEINAIGRDYLSDNMEIRP